MQGVFGDWKAPVSSFIDQTIPYTTLCITGDIVDWEGHWRANHLFQSLTYIEWLQYEKL